MDRAILDKLDNSSSFKKPGKTSYTGFFMLTILFLFMVYSPILSFMLSHNLLNLRS